MESPVMPLRLIFIRSIFLCLQFYFCYYGVFHSVTHFCTFCVVETIQCTYQITCDTADALETVFAVFFCSAAFRASITDDTVVAADRVTVNRVVDRTVANAATVLFMRINIFQYCLSFLLFVC